MFGFSHFAITTLRDLVLSLILAFLASTIAYVTTRVIRIQLHEREAAVYNDEAYEKLKKESTDAREQLRKINEYREVWLKSSHPESQGRLLELNKEIEAAESAVEKARQELQPLEEQKTRSKEQQTYNDRLVLFVVASLATVLYFSLALVLHLPVLTLGFLLGSAQTLGMACFAATDLLSPFISLLFLIFTLAVVVGVIILLYRREYIRP